jgi:hypothetical protein
MLNRRCSNRLVSLAAIAASCFVLSCGSGGGGGGGTAPAVPPELVKGQVIEGGSGAVLVCLDINANGRCDAVEPQARSDGGGTYQFDIPADATGALIAEVPSATTGLLYRMASPSRAYSANVSPYTTLVLLTGEKGYALAEDIVRDVVGLPPKFPINLDAAAPAGSRTQVVGQAVAAALQTAGPSLDLSAPDALGKVVAAFPTSLTGLPVFRISTSGGAPIVSRETYVDATFVLVDPATSTAAPLNGKIRGRGHSTWGQPKNPYKVQFKNDGALAALPDILGMKRSRNWALLADYFDRTLIRNKLALSLGSSSVFADGLKWTPSGQHVEVWLNEDYIGVYLMTEDIRIDASRLPIRQMSTDAAANEIDGGYIVEVDWNLDCYRGPDLDLLLMTPQGVPICIKDPDESDITSAQLAFIRNLLTDAEGDLYERLRTDRIDLASFADWYLINELFRNGDAQFISSVYMWKDTDAAALPRDRLLNLGPLWDFDRSAGNTNYNDNWLIEGCWVSKPYTPNWLSRLFDNAEFVNLTIAHWKQKRPMLVKFIDTGIDTYARRLAAAQQRNFERWAILGIPLVSYYTLATYGEEVDFLKTYLDQRIAWLDRALASPEAFATFCK